jgi:hypothetical protein
VTNTRSPKTLFLPLFGLGAHLFYKAAAAFIIFFINRPGSGLFPRRFIPHPN